MTAAEQPTLSPAVLQLAQAIMTAMAAINKTNQPEHLDPGRYVTEEVAFKLKGYTVKAIQKKRETGVWVESHEWVRAPDGRVLIDLHGVDRWAAGQRREGSVPKGTQSRSDSNIKAPR